MKPHSTPPDSQIQSWRLRRMCAMAMLCALAFLAVTLIRIPVVSFLKYEPKDVLLVIGGFLFGPVYGGLMCFVVSLVEMVTISDTGFIGFIMNLLSSGLFVCVAAGFYCRRRTLKNALLGLVVGVLAMTAGMLLWNYLITPLYMHVPRATIAGMLWTVFLPFNLLKGSLNGALAIALYKSVAGALRAAHLFPPTKADSKPIKEQPALWLGAAFVAATLVVTILVWSGKI